jgi:predicted amidohydrolase
MEALDLIAARVRQCEAEHVSVLCCPEAILGGLADHSPDPRRFAIRADGDRLAAILGPLASDTVTTIVGFTELADGDRLFNSAAVLERGSVVGLYRKHHPAINRSVYEPGCHVRVFQARDLTFGIVICHDSNFTEPARTIAALGATALFVPTNNALPPHKGGAALVAAAREADAARATGNGVWVIRADVAGRCGGLVSHGSSGIVDPDGAIVCTARPLADDLIVAETGPGARRQPPPHP